MRSLVSKLGAAGQRPKPSLVEVIGGGADELRARCQVREGAAE